MPVFIYKGYDGATGATRKGRVEADNPKAARQKLRQKNNILVSELKEEAAADKLKDSGKPRFTFTPSVKLQDLAIMTRQFATLQSAHIPLDESLKALTSQVENIVLRNTLVAVKDQVSEGKSLAEASRSYPAVFNRLYVNMVRAGESSGTLGLVLERLADFMEYQVKIRGQILSALTYPVLMIVSSLGIIGYLLVSVVPKLTKVFDNLRVTLPWYTSLLIKVSNFIQTNWYVLIVLIFAGAYFFKRWLDSEQGRRKFDRLLLQMPIFGPIVLRVSMSRFTRTLSTLLSSGVPIINAMEITRNVITNSVIAEVMDGAKIAVQEGRSLAQCFENSPYFPPLVVHMIRTGEKTGQLEEMLKHVAVAYDAEVERKLDGMISLIEPLMIMMIGGITVLIVAAMLVPMLSVMNQVR